MPKKKDLSIDPTHFRVTIFGSARIKRGDAQYKLVYTLAKMLAKEEIDLITGGGPGLMNAANQGHHAGKGNNDNIHSIGLAINLPFESKKAYHLDIQHDFDRFSHRLDTFMQLSNVVVVAPGGIGTTLELFYTWQLMQVKHICDTPIILLGEMWVGLIAWVRKYQMRKNLVSKEDLNSIFVARNCTEAMTIINKAHAEFKKGDKNICLNIKKYTKMPLIPNNTGHLYI